MLNLIINRTYIHADWKGCGVAKNLLGKGATRIEPRGARSVWNSQCSSEMREPLPSMMKSGFAAVGSTTFPVGEDLQTDIVMEIALAETIEEESTR